MEKTAKRRAEWFVLRTQYCSGDQIEKNEMSGICSTYGKRRGVYSVFFVGKPELKKAVGRPRPRWEDNIKVDLQEVGCGGVDWMDGSE